MTSGTTAGTVVGMTAGTHVGMTSGMTAGTVAGMTIGTIARIIVGTTGGTMRTICGTKTRATAAQVRRRKRAQQEHSCSHCSLLSR